ncbi:hypothetical protein GCM10010207_51910 [Streptomyces atratus]|nr:hypothetical protein GCM10010207_51910 [Streptomyces atratus]
MHLDPGIGEPGESRVPEVMAAQVLVPELGGDVVPVGGVTQDCGGDTAAPRPGDRAGVRFGVGCQNVLGDERADLLDGRDLASPFASVPLSTRPPGAGVF